MDFRALSSVELKFLAKFSSNIKFLIWQPTKISFLTLSFTAIWKLNTQVGKIFSTFAQDFQKFLHNSQLYVQWRQKHLLGIQQRRILNIKFYGNHVPSGWPVLHSVALFICSTVSEPQKTSYIPSAVRVEVLSPNDHHISLNNDYCN